MIKYQVTRIGRSEFDPWKRDEGYDTVVMSEKGSYGIVGLG